VASPRRHLLALRGDARLAREGGAAGETFVIADGLHMNDWGYACFVQLLGDYIIPSVGQMKLVVAVPSEVLKYKPT
jgi:hypothetical protein